MPISDFLHPVFIGIITLGFFGLLGFIYYIESKKPKEKTDPVVKGIMLSLLLIGLLFLAELIGFFEKGWNQKHFLIHIAIGFVIIGIYLIVAYRKKPLSYSKQKQIVKGYAISEYGGAEYVGDADIDWLEVYKLTVEGKSQDTRGEVGNFLVVLKAKNLKKIWIQINVFTGQLLHLQKEPPIELMNRLLGQESPKNDPLAGEFEEARDNPDEDENK